MPEKISEVPDTLTAPAVTEHITLFVTEFVEWLDGVTQEWCLRYDQQLRVHVGLEIPHLETCLLDHWCQEIERRHKVALLPEDIVIRQDVQSLAWCILLETL